MFTHKTVSYFISFTNFSLVNTYDISYGNKVNVFYSQSTDVFLFKIRTHNKNI